MRTQDPENFDEEVKSLVTAWFIFAIKTSSFGFSFMWLNFQTHFVFLSILVFLHSCFCLFQTFVFKPVSLFLKEGFWRTVHTVTVCLVVTAHRKTGLWKKIAAVTTVSWFTFQSYRWAHAAVFYFVLRAHQRLDYVTNFLDSSFFSFDYCFH